MALLDSLKDIGINFNFSSLTTFLIYFLIFLFFIVISLLIFWKIYQKKVYKIKIVDFKEIGGNNPQIVRKDIAKIVSMDKTGELLLFLKRAKIYRIGYGDNQSINEFWYIIGDDGYAHNVTLEGYDSAAKKLNLKIVHPDMRMVNVALRKILKDRAEGKDFWAKYGGLIAYVALIAITGLMMWFLFDSFIELTDKINTLMQTSIEVQSGTKDIVSGLDSLKQTGGLRPV